MEKIKLCIYKNNLKIDDTYAFVGRNGITNNKKEGDGKTPSGKFKLGVAFGSRIVAMSFCEPRSWV